MDSARTQPDPWGERLPRQLGLLSAVAVLVGTTIGSGIFRVPAVVAAQLQEPGPVMLAWIIGGLFSLCGALTLAELAASLPRSGGIFAYILEGFGPLPAFLFGWAEMTVIRAAALGGTATICAEYIGFFIPLSTAQVHYVAAALILLLATVNYIGITRAAALMNVLTVIKFGALAALALFAFTLGTGSASHFTPAFSSGLQLSLIATALIPIMWTYEGWSNLTFIAGEVKNPQRTLPLTLVFGTLSIIAVYLSVNLAFIYLVPLPEMAGAKLVAAEAASRIPLFGTAGVAVIAGIVVVSAFGSLNGSIMTGPRVVFAMADRGLFFQGIARVSPRFQTPSVAIWLAAGIGVIYVLQNDFAQLADKFILGAWPFFALAVAAVFVLRRRQPNLKRPYRTWGYPVTPLLFLGASLWMVINALITDPVNTGATFAIILSGIPAYYLWRRWNK